MEDMIKDFLYSEMSIEELSEPLTTKVARFLSTI